MCRLTRQYPHAVHVNPSSKHLDDGRPDHLVVMGTVWAQSRGSGARGEDCDVHATRAAVEESIVPGRGPALVRSIPAALQTLSSDPFPRGCQRGDKVHKTNSRRQVILSCFITGATKEPVRICAARFAPWRHLGRDGTKCRGLGPVRFIGRAQFGHKRALSLGLSSGIPR